LRKNADMNRGGGSTVSGQILNRRNQGTHSSTMKMNSYAAPVITVPVSEGMASAMDLDCISEPGGDRENLLRGILVAMGIQLVAAMCFYAIWQFMHNF
jgi:hypothetical protein